MTLAEKIDLLGGVDGFYIRAVPGVGLPRLKMSDGPMGVRGDAPATAAGGIALAATWNTALAESLGAQIGREARARGVHFLLGPGINLYVAPMNGRNFEYFGEDPFLAGRIAVSYIHGVHAQGVSATVKHFMGNNSEYDRHNVDALIDERTMREIYLPAFESAVKEGHAGAVMGSYNLVNGRRMTENPYLNTDVAKKGWGFEGVIVSDWSATYDGVAAANSGVDIEMPSGAFMNRGNLLPAIEKGQISVATIDDKARRILRLAARFGWLDREPRSLPVSQSEIGGGTVALQIAREGMVLLKNDSNLLPVARGSIKSIAVIGPNAHPAVPVGGGSAAVKPFSAVSFFDGLTNALAQSAAVYTHRGIPDWSQLANATFFSTEASGRQAGIKVEIFHNKDLSGTPAITRVDQHIDASLSAEDEGSSVRWSGFYHANAAGLYRAFVQSASDGACGFRLFVDNELVIDDWSLRKAAIDQANVQLGTGAHKFVFERYQSGVNSPGNPVRVGIAPAESLVDPEAKALAAESDLVVLAVGYDNESETEGSDRTFGLPMGQDELIREIAALNKRSVVVVTSGGGVDMNSWLDRVPALIQAWYPGQEGGAALAEIVLGDVNPSGRLPVSFETRWEDNPSYESYYPDAAGSQVIYRSGVFVGYRGYGHNRTRPLFPFGFGLSYTSFRYSRLTIKPLDNAASYEVSFDVTNTGTREGAEVAQVYVGDAHASVPRPPKELKGFAKVTLQPGETGTVQVKLDARSFAWFDRAGQQWKAEPGDFDVLVGPSSAQIELRDKITLPVPVTISILTAIA